MSELESLKKKIIYRANYRGTKEMDILLSKFVNKYIDKLNEKNLQDLYDFLNLEDEYIYNFYQSKDGEKKMKITKFLIYLKILKFNGGEGGIRTHERVAPLLVFKTSAFNRSATSPEKTNEINTIIN